MVAGLFAVAFFALVIGVSVRALFANRRRGPHGPYEGNPASYAADPYCSGTTDSNFSSDVADSGCADGGSADAGGCDGGGGSGE